MRRVGEGIEVEEIEALRGALTGYCYRMLGSAADTDDAVQEAVIRAYRARERFDPARGSLRTWVHGIATNVCHDMLRSARRRELLAPVPASRPGGPLGVPTGPDAWLEPMPDARTLHGTDPADPAAVAAQRESVRLAFLAALQHLPPRQRAVLLMRDVLAFSARETADALEMTVPATTSALQRARDTLARARLDGEDLAELDDAVGRDLLTRYIAAFQAHDVEAMRALLHEDATTSMPPFAWWLSGREDVVAVFAAADACTEDRLLPIAVNGTIGFGQYRPADDGELRPFAIVALEVREGLVARTITFLGSGPRFAEFGLPDRWPPDR